jgi:Na+/pantothenate symporter
MKNHMIQQSVPNGLVRDFSLSKQQARVLRSSLLQWNLLAKETRIFLIKSFRNQDMHYILISMSIAPTYVSAFNKPSSGGQSFTYALHLLVQF